MLYLSIYISMNVSSWFFCLCFLHSKFKCRKICLQLYVRIHSACRESHWNPNMDMEDQVEICWRGSNMTSLPSIAILFFLAALQWIINWTWMAKRSCYIGCWALQLADLPSLKHWERDICLTSFTLSHVFSENKSCTCSFTFGPHNFCSASWSLVPDRPLDSEL